MSSYKTGNWSNVEKKYMRDNLDKGYQDVARFLNRNPDTVRTYIETIVVPESKGEIIENDPQQSIKKTLLWKELRQQFTTSELEKFMFYWHKITAQFGADILATEEMQVVDYIRLELLGDRVLINQQQNLQAISKLEAKILVEKQQTSPDTDKIDNMVDQISMRRNAQESTTKEYKEIFMQKSKLLDQMKATRDARIKHLSSSKENIPDWMKKIMMDAPTRKKMGIYMAKVRLAQVKELERLTEWHVYQDKNIDIPILTSEIFKGKTIE